jgi:hypothetical protein
LLLPLALFFEWSLFAAVLLLSHQGKFGKDWNFWNTQWWKHVLGIRKELMVSSRLGCGVGLSSLTSSLLQQAHIWVVSAYQLSFSWLWYIALVFVPIHNLLSQVGALVCRKSRAWSNLALFGGLVLFVTAALFACQRTSPGRIRHYQSDKCFDTQSYTVCSTTVTGITTSTTLRRPPTAPSAFRCMHKQPHPISIPTYTVWAACGNNACITSTFCALTERLCGLPVRPRTGVVDRYHPTALYAHVGYHATVGPQPHADGVHWQLSVLDNISRCTSCCTCWTCFNGTLCCWRTVSADCGRRATFAPTKRKRVITWWRSLPLWCGARNLLGAVRRPSTWPLSRKTPRQASVICTLD